MVWAVVENCCVHVLFLDDGRYAFCSGEVENGSMANAFCVGKGFRRGVLDVVCAYLLRVGCFREYFEWLYSKLDCCVFKALFIVMKLLGFLYPV